MQMLTVTTTGGARKPGEGGEGTGLQQGEETQSLVCNAGLGGRAVNSL